MTFSNKLHKVLPLILLLFIAALLRVWLSSGVEGSDDVVHIVQADKIASEKYESPTYIAHLRIGTILPIALIFKLFGANTFTIFLWPLIASLTNIIIVYLIAFQLLGDKTAKLAALCMAFFPLDIHMGGRAMTESPLVLMLSLSVLFYLLGYKQNERFKSILFYTLSGFFVGLAALNKHPAVLIVLFFAVHSVLNKNPIANLVYLLTGGFVVFIFENAYLYFLSGDPFFLYNMFTKTMNTNRIITTTRGSLTSYFYYMFISLQHVGLYFYLMLFGLFHFLKKRNQDNNEATGIKFFLIWGLSLICIMTFLPIHFKPLIFIPKQSNYMVMFSAPFIILAGYSLSCIQRKRIKYIVIAILCSTSVFCAYFQRNTIKSHSYNTETAIKHIKKFPNLNVITGKYNTHYFKIHNILHNDDITYCFFDELLNQKIDKSKSYKYQKKPSDDQIFFDAIANRDKVLVFYDMRMARRHKNRKHYYPDISIFQNPKNNFTLVATIEKEKKTWERIFKTMLENLALKMENYAIFSNFAQKTKRQIHDVFNPEPAYLFMKK